MTRKGEEEEREKRRQGKTFFFILYFLILPLIVDHFQEIEFGDCNRCGRGQGNGASGIGSEGVQAPMPLKGRLLTSMEVIKLVVLRRWCCWRWSAPVALKEAKKTAPLEESVALAPLEDVVVPLPR